MLRIVPHRVPRVGRSYEHFPDGFELHPLQSGGEGKVEGGRLLGEGWGLSGKGGGVGGDHELERALRMVLLEMRRLVHAGQVRAGLREEGRRDAWVLLCFEGFRVPGLGSWGWGVGLRVESLGFRVVGFTRSWQSAATRSAVRSHAVSRASVPVFFAMANDVCVTSKTWEKLW